MLAKEINLMGVSVGPKKLEIQNRPLPEEPLGENEVTVQIVANGLCGSDCHVWAAGPRTSPLGLGHEAAGIIVEMGKRVTDRSVGQRVAIEPGFPCMKYSLISCHL